MKETIESAGNRVALKTKKTCLLLERGAHRATASRR
jgi:hypothetical protein